VQVGVPLKEVSRGGHGDHDAGARLAPHREPDQLLDGLGPRAGQLREQLAAAVEQGTQQARDGQDDVAGGDFGQDVVAQPLGSEELLLLLTRRAEAASAAGEATRTLRRHSPHQSRETVIEQAAAQELA
jgi:hypothetical protein